MTLDLAGVIAEVVGATAVVGSLIYLALQVRENSIQNTVNRSSTILDEFNRMQEVLISSADVIDLFTKMKEKQDLSSRDDVLLESVANRILTHWYSIEGAFARGAIEKQLYDTFCEDVGRYIGSYPQMHEKFLQITSLYSEASDLPIFAPLYENANKQ